MHVIFSKQILSTQYDVAYFFVHCIFAITLREPMTRMENEIVRQYESRYRCFISILVLREPPINADFS